MIKNSAHKLLRCYEKEFNLVKFEVFSPQLYYKPAALLKMNSFNGVVPVFYVLFRSKHRTSLGGCSHCMYYMLILKCCSVFFSTFQKHAFCKISFGGCSYYINCKILNVQKTIEVSTVVRRRFVKKVFLKNFEKITGKHLCQSPFFGKVPG